MTMLNRGGFNNDMLNAKRLVCDSPADDVIMDIFGDATQKQLLFKRLSDLNSNAKVAEFAAAYPGHSLFATANQLPQWANAKLIAQGTAFFATHAEAIMNLLGLLSLPYCYAAADGAMVLYLSERLKTDAAKRLQETGEFVWEVLAPDSFSDTGKGFAAILKVRLIHAAARYYSKKSGQWDDAWGMPVNQEDMAGTNLAFSLIVIRGLRKMGFTIAAGEQQAFLHLWSVIGSLLGIGRDLLPADIKQVRDLEEAIRERQFRASSQGQALTLSLTTLFADVGNNSPDYNKQDVLSLMRYLVGGETADILGIGGKELTPGKLRLIQTLSLWQDLKPGINPAIAYREAYYKFKAITYI